MHAAVHLSPVFDYLPKSMLEYYDAIDKNKINFTNLLEQLLFFLQESHEEKQVPSSPSVSPPSSLINKKVENLESAVDIPERPSPVSVLEPLFTDDDISPTKSISRSGRQLF